MIAHCDLCAGADIAICDRCIRFDGRPDNAERALRTIVRMCPAIRFGQCSAYMAAPVSEIEHEAGDRL